MCLSFPDIWIDIYVHTRSLYIYLKSIRDEGELVMQIDSYFSSAMDRTAARNPWYVFINIHFLPPYESQK